MTEVAELLARYPPDLKPLNSLGYRHLSKFLRGEWSWEEAIERLKIDTRHYAKRQLTWFKTDPEVRWFHPGQIEALAACLEEFFLNKIVLCAQMYSAKILPLLGKFCRGGSRAAPTSLR